MFSMLTWVAILETFVTQIVSCAFLKQFCTVLLYLAEVKEVKDMNYISTNQHPAIAIITANYCEKLAVDEMMEDKTTYVKLKMAVVL